MVAAARQLEAAGAGCVVICTNTMHKMADEVQASVGIPLLHIADAAARAVRERGLRRVALLGTRYTMAEDFYTGRLARKFGLDVLVPGAADQEEIHRIIYSELVIGITTPASRTVFQQVIGKLAAQGAEGIILGCTEIGLLVRQSDSPLPLFDTTQLHARAAVDFALAE